jgi:uncharacterized membrane protein
MSKRPMFIYVAAYDDPEDAATDYATLLDLHSASLVGSYDVAIIGKDAEGKVHVTKHEKPTQHGTWSGLAVGAVAGILFPPSILGSAVVGGAAGGLIGHLARGMSRHDMHEIGEMLEEGQAALVIVGQSRIEEQVTKELTKAQKSMEREVDADADEFEAALRDAEREQGSAA